MIGVGLLYRDLLERTYSLYDLLRRIPSILLGRMAKALGLLLLFARVSLQQKDPLIDFCRRFGHQTCVIDTKLYIDGGQVDWNPVCLHRRPCFFNFALLQLILTRTFRYQQTNKTILVRRP